MDNERSKKRKTLLSFFKHKENSSTSTVNEVNLQSYTSNTEEEQPVLNFSRVEIDLNNLERDPAIRIPIWQHPINQQDEIRRSYIRMGPYQPKLDEYPRTKFGSQTQYRRFQYSWFEKFPWLEYSSSKDLIFCFPCFLFQKKSPINPSFTIDGFNNWKRVNDGVKCPLLIHVGGPTSSHSNSVKCVEDLMKVSGHIDNILNAQSLDEVQKNRLRLKTTIESIRWLSLQACAFRGHDESSSSKNRGNFIEMIKLMGRLNVNIGDIVLKKAPRNATYTSPTIQKEILHIFANKMSIILRFVDFLGILRERFFDIVNVPNTTTSTLKKSISDVLSRHNLNVTNMRGQGYDGASNMSGAWNGLQALFLRECPYAYYIHCFAHRLQLALVGASTKEISVWLFFSKLSTIINLIGCSSKWHSELHSAQTIEIDRMITSGERDTGKGMNQIGNLHRSGSTRWSSHFESICSLIDMFGATISVLESIVEEGSSSSLRGEACGCLITLKSFEFVFTLYMMQKIMGITNLLCQALQNKSLDIINAMDLVSTTKALLFNFREEGFDHLLEYVQMVCTQHDIEIPDLNASYKSATRRSCQQKDSLTIQQHYHFNIFNSVIDFQQEELNSRFSDEAVELLKLSYALDPKDNFKSFKGEDICKLAEKYYPGDFSEQEMHYLRSQLQHYKIDVSH
ncbi:zinc finger MYM-type protein 1-like [Impatiens glandulifera]|uniref:zinc finger MYM-type protein 1-like n=1 Tax=Impatiens glandulifera TaxID=253017 RepID=UPI001FB0EB20|nr:zinc finger MYM-type protein 1-like [Impatiens glandulifera]